MEPGTSTEMPGTQGRLMLPVSISWQIMVVEINCAAEAEPKIIEIKERKTGVLSRGSLTRANTKHGGTHLVLESSSQYVPKCNGKGRVGWTNIGYIEITNNLAKERSLPIRLPDGRIIFSVNGFDYTIYPYKSVDCPY
jgi:hypothetical protein